MKAMQFVWLALYGPGLCLILQGQENEKTLFSILAYLLIGQLIASCSGTSVRLCIEIIIGMSLSGGMFHILQTFISSEVRTSVLIVTTMTFLFSMIPILVSLIRLRKQTE